MSTIKLSTADTKLRKYGFTLTGLESDGFVRAVGHGHVIEFISRHGQASNWYVKRLDAPADIPEMDCRHGIYAGNLTQAIRMCMNRYLREELPHACGGRQTALTVSVTYKGASIQPRVQFHLYSGEQSLRGTCVLNKDDKVSVGMALSWLDGELPTEHLLDWLSDEAGDPDMAERVNFVRSMPPPRPSGHPAGCSCGSPECPEWQEAMLGT
jgi:hypothetical protein